MASYDYRCPECEDTEEEVHGMTEEPEIICEKCLAKNPARQVRKVKLISRGTTFLFPGVVARWMNENYEKYRGNKLTEADENTVKDPNFQGQKDYHTRS